MAGLTQLVSTVSSVLTWFKDTFSKLSDVLSIINQFIDLVFDTANLYLPSGLIIFVSISIFVSIIYLVLGR